MAFEQSTPRHTRWLFALATICILVRLAPFFATPGLFQSDPDAYRQLAENLVVHHTFGFHHQPTAYRPPLYPLLLTICVAGPFSIVWRIAALHLMLGLLTLLLVWQLARRCLPFPAACLALLLVACDPLLLHQSTQIMTETLAAFLATLLIWTWTRATEQPTALRFALVGLTLGLATLCRPTFLPWLALAPFSLLVDPRLRSQFFYPAGVLIVATLLTLAPWIIRNYRVFERPIVGTTHGGYTLFLANNPFYYQHLHHHGWRAVWNPADFHTHVRQIAPPPRNPRGELTNDRRLNRMARTAIQFDTASFQHAALVRLATFWGVSPTPTPERQSRLDRAALLAISLWYAIELPLALLGIISLLPRWRQPSWLAPLALLACFTTVHLFYWTDLRMRAPLMPLVALAVPLGTLLLRDLIPRHKSQPTSQLNT